MAANYASTSLPQRSAAPQAPASVGNVSNAPQGTFLPGTKVHVGNHRVIIEKYLSEGGFAHVYVVRVPREGNKYELAVLKRVAVPDKGHLASMRTEVETMKKLKGHRHIVTYFDSHASQLKGGGYEVFLLMEYCQGGGLIDFMNTRLQHRLVEAEILKIFGDVAEGVACMHYLKPPLLHRDLKVENVLIAKSGKDAVPIYKLCDFGSTAPPRPAATTAEEGRLIEDDVQRHTTMQYRSPEMIDVWRKRPIDEKADIWALGVLLYKLCYYTTPFEEVGQMAILNATFKYPALPQFSPRLKKLIGGMLKEDPIHRPNIYQVIKELCSMRGIEVPIKDIYTSRTHSEARRNESLPMASAETASLPPAIGLQRATPQTAVEAIPDIAPMRRGRPTAPAESTTTAAKPDPSPAKGDPFAALDSKSYEVRAGAVDELSNRFPSLNEFSITQKSSAPFQFNTSNESTSTGAVKAAKTNLHERVTHALADDAFASVRPTTGTKRADPVPPVKSSSNVREIPLPTRKLQASDSGYKSTGTGSSPPLPPKSSSLASAPKPDIKLPNTASRPIWRVPSTDHERSTSQPRASPDARAAATYLQPSLPPTHRPALLDMHRSKSQTSTVSMYSDNAPDTGAEGDPALLRTRTMQNRSRPSSAYLSSNLDFLRDQESSRKTSSEYKRGLESRRHSRQQSPRLIAADDGDFVIVEDAIIDNDMDFLHSKEEDEAKHKHGRKSSSGFSLGHKKRNSLPSITIAAKDVFKGAFSSAFNRFEGNNKADGARTPSDLGTHTPDYIDKEPEAALLSPIAGSEATLSKHSDETYSNGDDVEDLPLEVKREMERRRLSAEERRVAEAARQYKERVASNASGGPNVQVNRGTAIQQRVQSLLDEGSRPASPIKRTAEGYGRYTNASTTGDDQQAETTSPPPRTSSLSQKPTPAIIKPVNTLSSQYTQEEVLARAQGRQAVSATSSPALAQQEQLRSPELRQAPLQRSIERPSAPPKPKVLRTAPWPRGQGDGAPAPVEKALPPAPSGGLAALLAKDLEGVPDYSARESGDHISAQPPVNAEEVEREFSRRYPSLSGIEMVETDVGSRGAQTGRVREV